MTGRGTKNQKHLFLRVYNTGSTNSGKIICSVDGEDKIRPRTKGTCTLVPSRVPSYQRPRTESHGQTSGSVCVQPLTQWWFRKGQEGYRQRCSPGTVPPQCDKHVSLRSILIHSGLSHGDIRAVNCQQTPPASHRSTAF